MRELTNIELMEVAGGGEHKRSCEPKPRCVPKKVVCRPKLRRKSHA